MASEVIKLNLIPSGEMPTFHCSQFDNGREIKIELYNGEDAYTLPTGYTAELHTRKMDNNIVTLSSTSVVSNLVTFTSTEQLTACAGNNLSEVSIKDASDYVVGTLNFWLYVEKDPLQGGLTSTSAIHDLTDQIEEITTEIVGENYYNKSETDDLLDLKADKSTTYTKTEVNTLLTAKADKTSVYTKTETNSLLAEKADADDVYTKSQVETKLAVKANAADVYTKSETDDLLDAKADANAVYGKTQVYNKTETDALLAAKADSADLSTVATTGDYDDLINKPTIPAAQIQSDYAQADNTKVDYIKNKPDIDGMIADALMAVMPVDSAGPSAIANFNTELAVDLVDCKTTLTPSLVGYSAVNLTACGVNLFNNTAISQTSDNVVYTVNEDKSITANGTSNGWNGLALGSVSLPAGTFYLASDYSGTSSEFYVEMTINGSTVSTYSQTRRQFTLTQPSTGTIKLITPSGTTANNFKCYPAIYKSNTDLYSPYNGQTYAIAFGQTVYGGVLDVTRGKLTVTHGGVDLSTMNWTASTYGYRTADIASDVKTPATDNIQADIIAEEYNPVARNNIGSQGDNNIAISTSGNILVSSNSMPAGYAVYELATPFDIDLTPEVISAVVGVNNVYSDTGDTTIKFKDSIQHYIDTH